MHKFKSPYTRNEYLENSSTNRTFAALKKLDQAGLEKWFGEFSDEVVHAWDVLGVPIIGGQPEDSIVADFKRLAAADPKKIERTNEHTGLRNCIENTYAHGSLSNQFFPTMLKTKDISSNSHRVSLYDRFAEAEPSSSTLNGVRKLIHRDPHLSYSEQITGFANYAEWRTATQLEKHQDFWLCKAKENKPNQLIVSKAETQALLARKAIDHHQVFGDVDEYAVHVYDTRSKIMDNPKMWRMAFEGTPATNFPPMVAKYLYEKFAISKNPEEPAIVYDPSAGWGGRILAAMSCAGNCSIHYVGTDPNTDHWMTELEQTKYEFLADYFNSVTHRQSRNSYDVFQCGSEEIHKEDRFQQYEGKVDFVFTSPPYFAAEGYSEDKTQSHIKFPTYDAWVDGFLKPTLRTAVDWLRGGGFLCINISDVRMNGKLLPLQADTVNILTRLGLGRHEDIKMVLKDAPLGSKQTERGIPTTRNFCKINGKNRKYEPIFVFQKFIDYD